MAISRRKHLSSHLIPTTFQKIMQSSAYTVFILSAEEKQFAIYADPKIGQMIQTLLSDKPPPRPYTHELLNQVLVGLDIKILQAVIYDVNDTVYYARLFIEQIVDNERRIVEIDARPSDCLTLALMNNIPIFCREEAYEKIIPLESFQ